MTSRILYSSILWIAVLSCFSRSIANAQENIDIPLSSQSKPPSQSKPSPTISLRLAAEKGEKRVYYTTDEWKKLSIEERVEINKIGLVVGQGEKAFLLSLFNNLSRGTYGIPVSFQEAFNNTAGQLPTKTQMQTIKNYERRIDDALLAFGGQYTNGTFYWCKDGSSFFMGSNRTTFDNKALYRLATDDIEGGFKEVTVTKENDEDFDYYGADYSEWYKGKGYLRVVGHHGKYGFINEDRELVIPLKFDSIIGDYYLKNSSMNLWDGNGLIAVCINSKWGYINRDGNTVVPIIYEEVDPKCYEPDESFLGAARVYKEGLYGGINYKGELVLPLQFSNLGSISVRDSRDLVFAQKENKYGFFDTNFKLVIPFRYDDTSGFSKDSPLCAVKLNGKYGYIDKKGEVIIPPSYDFAAPFFNGLAAVVKNGKCGFINTDGDVVIPFQFEVAYSSSDYDSFTKKGHKDLYLGCDFKWSPYVSFVKSKNGKYGIINNKGELIVDYKYDTIKSAGSDGFTVMRDNETFYIGHSGKEYSSIEERRARRTDEINFLAELGFPEYQFQLGEKFDSQKEYQIAYEWYYKASQNGSVEALELLGDLYYYKDKLERSYTNALNWYFKYVTKPSAHKWRVFEKMGKIFYHGGYGVETSYSNALSCFTRSETKPSKYYLGWMYEHGQGVEKDINKAIEFYQKSGGHRDANDRIKMLQSN